MAFPAVALLLAVAQGPFGPDSSRDMVLMEKNAILMAPPDVVCGPMVQSMKWSSDGKWLAVDRVVMDLNAKVVEQMMLEKPGEAMPKAQRELLVWGVASKNFRKVLSMPLTESMIVSYDWLPGSGSLVAHLKHPAEKKDDQVMLISANGTMTQAFSIPPTDFIEYAVSPTKPIVGYTIFKDGGVNTEGTIRFVTPTGVSSDMVLPKMTAFLRWSQDGSKAMVQSVYRGQVSGNTLSPGWYTINRETGRFDKAEKPEDPKPAVKAMDTLPISVEVLKGEGLSAKAPVIILRGDVTKDGKPSSVGVVSSDGYSPSLSPDQTSVAYISQGVAMVRALIPVPKEAFLAARAAAQRAEVMSKAKQIGVAFQMIAADMDDNFPENKGWADKLMPYVKNGSMLDGFNYTFAGGAVNDPSKTMLGFMSGPGGRAVVYADGHVRWIAD